MSVGNGGASSNSNQSRERTEGERGAAHIDDGELLGEARGAVEVPESSTAMAVEVEEGDDGAGIDEVASHLRSSSEVEEGVAGGAPGHPPMARGGR